MICKAPTTSAGPQVVHQAIMARRMEIKYLVDRTTRTALTRDLTAFMRPDAYAGSGGTYLVRSLYFDTPYYMAYHEKLSGAATRHKLRIRAYGNDPRESPYARLEVKSRHLSFIHKLTVDVPWDQYEEVERAISNRTLPPEHLLADSSVSQEFFRLLRQFNMEPKTLLQYRRQAFERTDLHRLRVNFDDELVACSNLRLLGPLEASRRLLRYGNAVFEVKADGALPFWMHTLIAKYNLDARPFSKYCYAVRSEGRMSVLGREEDEFC